MAKVMTNSGRPSLILNNPDTGNTHRRQKQSIGVAQLAEVLRLVERQLPIVLSSNLERNEKEYLLYLTDRVLKYSTEVCRHA